VAAVKIGAVVERDRLDTRQVRQIDSWRAVLERGLIPSVRKRPRWALTLGEREEISCGMAMAFSIQQSAATLGQALSARHIPHAPLIVASKLAMEWLS
jgi:hypothetical protein